MLSLLFQLLLFSKPSFEASLCNNLYNGTTKNFKDIVLGRCFYYINSLHKDNCEINSANLNCSLIWDEFYRVIVNKSPCQVSIEDFDQFVHLTSHPYSNEKSVFWSGTYKAVHQISRLKGDWTLEDTLSGYLLDGLSFCSDNKSDNFLTICPTDCVTRNNPFWNAVSKNYASKATGRVTAVLNGTRNSGALSNYSTFFNYELPSMNFKNINHFQVILLHSPEMSKYETCQMPKTLNTLRNILQSNNVTYECIDDNFYLKNFLCIENQNSPECQKLFSAFSKTSSVIPFWHASASIIALTTFNLLF
ncbi:ADP-ribosyl cyclase cyclic ADP-ribose hydrolase 1 [Brachionus plicatilis]|uniref:ADP-ribosyl cyclase cyclic ADP-ribose hydrolase 1 n=1 Tax=Brachionus plicatilis TaxID=10195 RepID=A0A3M7SNQ1_BRAPC|nr:ADP-ribosyl cyclase cyclic ADP-ribose hydrolase 1 [Brachionus plicatilis]